MLVPRISLKGKKSPCCAKVADGGNAQRTGAFSSNPESIDQHQYIFSVRRERHLTLFGFLYSETRRYLGASTTQTEISRGINQCGDVNECAYYVTLQIASLDIESKSEYFIAVYQLHYQHIVYTIMRFPVHYILTTG